MLDINNDQMPRLKRRHTTNPHAVPRLPQRKLRRRVRRESDGTGFGEVVETEGKGGFPVGVVDL
jgi:hypothetical protein